LEDVYNPIRAAIQLVIAPSESTKVEEPVLEALVVSESKAEPESGSGYYKIVNRETMEGNNPEDEVGEKALLNEIEKFRMRALQRDK
jgi:hypothetical protein